MDRQDDPILSIRNLSINFGGVVAIKNINLDVAKGEKIAIIGGSGCGKSVFLRCCEMLIRPDRGSIRICGEDICAKDADIDKIRMNAGMVFQNYNLFSHMNVIENLCLAPMHLLKMPQAQARKRARELLKTVGLSGHEYSWPIDLSGGQQQRVAIARCLMMNPKLMFLDEPTSALDPLMVGEVLATVRALGKQGMTMLIVTHEMNFAREFADRVLFFSDGIIYEQGTPDEIFGNPKGEKTKSFVYKLKHFEYHIASRQFNLTELQNGIKAFIERYYVENKRIWHLQLCTEELIGIIIENTSEEVDMNVSIEFSELSYYVILKIDWIGQFVDPFAEGMEKDNLGISILKSMSEKKDQWEENGRHFIEVKLV